MKTFCNAREFHDYDSTRLLMKKTEKMKQCVFSFSDSIELDGVIKQSPWTVKAYLDMGDVFYFRFTPDPAPTTTQGPSTTTINTNSTSGANITLQTSLLFGFLLMRSVC